MYNLNVADVTSLPILTYAMHLFQNTPQKMYGILIVKIRLIKEKNEYVIDWFFNWRVYI
jgi:hypothetical protein